MNLFKRIGLSITRRISRSIVLGFIVFSLGNVLCASIAITSSMNRLENDFKNQLGNKITINFEDGLAYQGYEDEKFQKNLNRLLTDIKLLSNKGYIKYQDNQYLLQGLHSEELTYTNRYMEDQPCDLSNGLFITGITETQLIDQVDGKIELINGRVFTKEEIENGKNVTIVSDRFKYQGKEINVGDKISIDRIVFNSNFQEVYKESVEYEVIGIFKKTDVIGQISTYSFENYSARIYVPYTTAIQEYSNIKSLIQAYQGLDISNFKLQKIILKLSNAKYEEDFYNMFDWNNELIKTDDNTPIYKVTTSEDIFNKITKPLESLSKISSFFEIVSTISVCVLLCLTIFIFLKERRYEIGILYAMGQKKIQIINQYVLETLLIGLLVISLAMFSGYEIGKMYTNKMVENQLESSKYVYVEEYSQEKLLEEYEIEFDFDYIKNVYLYMIGIISISSIVPISYILKLNPKKILL